LILEINAKCANCGVKISAAPSPNYNLYCNEPECVEVWKAEIHAMLESNKNKRVGKKNGRA
jgi:hypothetical protein